MTLTRLALVVAAAWFASKLLAERARSARAELPRGRPTALGTRRADIDSPNEAEQLQARGVASPTTESDQAPNLFKSTSQDSAEAQSPGLPDFARGA